VGLKLKSPKFLAGRRCALSDIVSSDMAAKII